MNVVRGPLSRKIAAKTEIHGLLLRFVCGEETSHECGARPSMGEIDICSASACVG